VRSADTAPEAHAIQLGIYRSMSPGRRLALAVEMSEEASAMLTSGIEARHPDYSDAQVTWAFRRIRLGETLLRQVWPDAPLVAP
jgi:hypothetical protein